MHFKWYNTTITNTSINEDVIGKTVTETEKVVISGTLEEVKTVTKKLNGYSGDVEVELKKAQLTTPSTPETPETPKN